MPNTIQIANCDRCGVRLKVGSPPNEDARLLKRATVAQGVCVNCAVTAWFQTIEPIREIMGNPRCQTCGKQKSNEYDRHRQCTCAKPKFHTPQEIVALPHVQAIFAQILAAGNSDAKPDEIDWLEVAANWDLPMPKKRKKRKPPQQPELFP
jgi:hypothetical protein